MPLQHFMEKLHLDEAELQSRRDFFEITADDLERLASLRAFAEKHTDDIIEDHLLGESGPRMPGRLPVLQPAERRQAVHLSVGALTTGDAAPATSWATASTRLAPASRGG